MEAIEKEGDKKENKTEEISSSNIENAHASGDGALGRDEDTLITKKEEDKEGAIKKDADQY